MERRQGFFLTIGNGGGVTLKLNGESLGVPGEVGKVVRLKVPKDAVLEKAAEPPVAAPSEAGDEVLEGTDSTRIEDDGFDE